LFVAGRILGTSAAAITTKIATYMPGGTATRQHGYAAGVIGFLAYAAGIIAIFCLTQPRKELIME